MAHIKFEISGEGSPVVLIHGWATCAQVWNGLALELSKKFKVIVPDLRGHGRSTAISEPYEFKTFAGDIKAVIDSLNIKPVILVGWSMGASVALRLIDAYPGYVDRLVLISATPSLINRNGYSFGLPPVVVRRLAGQVERRFDQGIAKFYDMVFTPEELNWFGKNPLIDYAPLKRASVESLHGLWQEDIREILGAVNVPTLLIHGSADTICPVEGARYMKNKIKGSELLVLSNAGHAPFLTRPHEVVSAVEGFLLNNWVKGDYDHCHKKGV